MDNHAVANALKSVTPSHIALSIVAGSVLYLVSLAIYRLHFSALAAVPGPWYAAISEWPLVLQSLLGRRAYWAHDMHLRYGSEVRLAPNFVSFSDASYFSYVYGKLAKSDFYKGAEVIDGINHSMSSLTAGVHQPIRKVIAPTYSQQNVNGFEEELRNNIRNMLNRIDAAKGEHPIDILHLTKLLAADAVGFVAFGTHFNSVIEGHSKITKWLDQFSIFMAMKASMNYYFFNYFVTKLPIASLQEIFGIYSRFRNFSVSLFEPLKAKLTSDPLAIEQAGSALVARMLAVPLSSTGQRMTDDQIACELTGHLYAGSDTTAYTSTYCMWELARHPEVLKKLRSELDDALGGESVGTISALKQLPYLDAVVHESLRVHGAAPSHIPRVVDNNGLTMNGYYFPPGTEISAQSFTVHRNPQVFPRPDSFEPDRWLEADPEKKSQMLLHFIPFGTGPRICAGQVLAWADLRLIISSIAKRFDMAPAPNQIDIVQNRQEHFVSTQV